MSNLNEKLNRLHDIESFIPRAEETKKQLNELLEVLKNRKQKLQAIMSPPNNKGGLIKKLLKKGLGKAVQAGLEIMRINKAINQTEDYLVEIDKNISDIQTGTKGLKVKLQKSIKGTNHKFSESVKTTQLKINYLQKLEETVEESQKKIITKERQNTLSKDEVSYKIVSFMTLIVINITLFIYMTHLIHHSP